MFGTTLHEMCHAYEIVRCLAIDCDRGDGHGEYFRTRIHAVHRRALHLLGLWAIDRREAYRMDHLMSRDWDREWRCVRFEQGRRSMRGEAEERGRKHGDGRVGRKGECVIL